MFRNAHARRTKILLASVAAGLASLAGSARAASSQLIESWENTADGWIIAPDQSAAYSITGFSTTTGVTDGTYSLSIAGTAAPNYGQLLDSPSTMLNTQILGGQAAGPNPGQPALSLSLDIKTPSGSFGFGQQWDLVINNADTGYASVDGFAYSKSPSIGNQSTMTFPIPATITSVLATSTNPTQIIFQVGGGSGGTMTMNLDNLQAVLSPPTVLGSETANWKTNGNGAWETGTNWNSSPDANTPPGGVGSVITFDNNGGAITVNPTVTLSGPAVADILTFGSGSGTAVNYTIASGSSQAALTINNEMDALSGSHVINVPVGTGSGNFHFDTEAGATLNIPNFSDTSFGTITQIGTGTLMLGTTLHCSVIASGTITFKDNASGGFLFGITAPTGTHVNLGTNTWNTNSLNGDGAGGGVINVPTGGTLFTAEYLGAAPAAMNYSGTFSGGGSIVIGEGQTSTDTSQVIYGNTAVFFGNNSTFSGTITAGSSFPTGTTFMTQPAQFVLQVGAANQMGDGSATNKVILDGGILQTTASFTAPQAINITTKNGTIDTNGNDNSVGAIGGPGGLTKIGAGTLTLAGANAYAGNTTVSAGTMTLNAGGSMASANYTVAATATLNANGSLASTANVTANGTVNFGGTTAGTARTQALGSLAIASGVTVSITHSAFPFTPTLLKPTTTTLGDPTAKIDITNNAFATTGTAAGALLLIQANQIVSSEPADATKAIGYIDLGGADTGKFEVRYTLKGDTDLSGGVDVGDLGALATSYGITGGKSWANGDFNQDHNVDVGDLGALATNYGTQLATSPAVAFTAAEVATGAAVPEPASIGLLGIGAISLLTRRRRHLLGR